MIFVTVGTQLPFPRMIRAVALWASNRGRRDLYFQHGGYSGDLNGLANTDFLDAATAAKSLQTASIVVAHAGTGTILSCLERGIPCIIVPRHGALGEHRNDHQIATARKFEGRGGIFVAWSEFDIAPLLDRASELSGGSGIDPYASPELISAIRDFVWEGRSRHE
ncbi:MAG: glycosyltransferase [Limnohabitans sp.]|jgi:UDP-N-acetylglucosamine transferase subunit ALG13|nr:glycosyltransferase [Limnohabitans sp.]